MDKLIELIERHRDKWQKKWSKGTQLRDSNSEHYDPFLHGASVGATKAYNNVLQWIKNPSITKSEKDLIPLINRLCEAILFDWEDKAELARKIQNQIKEKE